MTGFKFRSGLFATISLSVLELASPAMAQDDQPEANQQASGNTIVVTGLRRSEELQDTPAAISSGSLQMPDASLRFDDGHVHT